MLNLQEVRHQKDILWRNLQISIPAGGGASERSEGRYSFSSTGPPLLGFTCWQKTEGPNEGSVKALNKESLNSKNEWGGAKIPSLLVSSPKGIAKTQVTENEGPEGSKEELPEHISVFRQAISRGQKRIQYREGNQDSGTDEEDTLYQEDSGQERTFNPRKRRRGNAMEKVIQESKDSPERVQETSKEGSPRNKPKTFTELALSRTEVKWNEAKKEPGKEGSPARKTARKSPGKGSPSNRTPVRLKVARIEKKVQKKDPDTRKVRLKASTPQRKRKVVKEPDLDPKQARIRDFLLRKHQPATTNNPNSKTQETVEIGGKEIIRGPLVVPFRELLASGLLR